MGFGVGATGPCLDLKMTNYNSHTPKRAEPLFYMSALSGLILIVQPEALKGLAVAGGFSPFARKGRSLFSQYLVRFM
jgi:hypothetical protein